MTSAPEKTPSETLREAARLLRRCAIANPKYLPIAEKIEGIADKQEEYELTPRIERELEP